MRRFKITFEVNADDELFTNDVEVNDLYFVVKYDDDECTKLHFDIQQIECEEVVEEETDKIL